MTRKNDPLDRFVQKQATQRQKRLAENVELKDWQLGSHYHLPFEEIRDLFLYFLYAKGDGYAITNLMKGIIAGKSAFIFDFQKITRDRIGKSVSIPATLLLIDLSPQKVPRFWFSKPTWADGWLRQQGKSTSIATQDFTIHGADVAELHQIFTPLVIDHYRGRDDYIIEGSDSFILLASNHPASTKETFITLLVEGEYALKHLVDKKE